MLRGRRPSGLRRGAGSSLSSPAGVAGGPHPGLLTDDHCGGGLADRQPPAEPVGLVVVVDEHGGAVLVAVQAAHRQAEDVFGAPPGVDGDLGGDLDLDRFEAVQIGAQHVHDLWRQVPSRLPAGGLGGDVTGPDAEVVGQPGRSLAGAGQAQGPDPGQGRAGAATDDVAVVTADLPG